MNILVNTRLLIPNKIEGIAAFTYNIFKKIIEAHPEHQFYFLFDRKYDNSFVFSKNVTPIVFNLPTRHPILNIIWFELVVPAIIKTYKIDLFISPDNLLSLSAKVPTILVVHDINFKRMPENLPFITRKYYNFFVPKFVKKATHIVSVSEFTKNELIDAYKVQSEKITVIYNAPHITKDYIPDNLKEEIQLKYTNGKPYFIYLGSLHPRKNIERMLEAFDNFLEITKKDMYFVIVGRHLWRSYKIKNYEKIKNKDKIIFTGYLEREETINLLCSAFALILVSLYEGFGIPVIEAMSVGVPVICSNTTALKEIANDSALLVNPFSVDEITSAMIKLTEDMNLYNNLKEKGTKRAQYFSWEKSSEELWQVIEKVINKK